MKIALVIDSLARGGAERQVLITAAALQGLGHIVEVITYHNVNHYIDLIDRYHITLTNISSNNINRLLRLQTLISILRLGQFDIVHGFKANASLYIRAASLFVKGPIYLGGYRSVTLYKKWRYPLNRLPFARPHGWIVNSISIKDSLHKHLKLPKDDIHIIPNGIDPDEWQCALTQETAKQQLDIKPDQLTVTIIAQLRDEKNHHLFLLSMKHVIESLANIKCLIVGDGSRQTELAAYARSLGISDQLHWLKERNDIPLILKASDVLVLTSNYESLPNVLIEAAISGVPCVSTPFLGAADIINHGRTGLISNYDSEKSTAAKAIAGHVKRLLNDPLLRKKLGDAAHKRALELYSMNSMGSQIEKVYLNYSEP